MIREAEKGADEQVVVALCAGSGVAVFRCSDQSRAVAFAATLATTPLSYSTIFTDPSGTSQAVSFTRAG